MNFPADGIPQDLKTLDHWVAWRYEWRTNSNGDRKRTKVPVSAHTGTEAKSTDSTTWSSFEDALHCAEEQSLAGIGFVFSPDDPYCGIDFDDCLDPTTGRFVDPVAERQVRALNSYTEISPSGTGCKVWIRAKKPGQRCRKGNIEMYDSGRYFTVTGQLLPGSPATIEDRQPELDAVYAEVFATEGKPAPQRPLVGLADDADLLERARSAANGAKFDRLWSGDITGYDSQSEADLALCTILAFWTGRDAGRMDRLFRQSGLYRAKWVERHGGVTYGEMTIGKAIESTAETYSPSAGSPPGSARPEPDGKLLFTDLGNCKRLVAAHGHDLRYVPELGWLAWDGQRWSRDSDGEVMRRAKGVVLALYDQAMGELGQAQRAIAERQQQLLAGEAAQDDALDERLKKAFAKAKALLKWAEKSQSRPRLEGMVALASTEKEVVASVDQLDADPWLLNVTNGTLDLRTGTLHPHRRENLLTKLAPVSYDPEARGDAWQAHLDRFLPDPDVRRQVQRDLGSSLVGAVMDELLPIWYGTGANGKTTTVRAVQGILGDYARQAAPDLLVLSRHDRHPTEVADLLGSRLVFSVEVDEGKRLAEALVKSLTGGDTKKARYMGRDFFEFEQSFSITLIVNHKPVISGTDEGIWRRVRLIPWTYRIPSNERRPQDEVVDELVADGAGILNWLLAGLQDWQRDRHWVAAEVQAATEAYRAEQDLLGDFLRDCCELGPRFTVPVAELYTVYEKWCGDTGEEALGKIKFSKLLRGRGISQKREAGGKARRWVGIRGAHNMGVTSCDKKSEDFPNQKNDFPGEIFGKAVTTCHNPVDDNIEDLLPWERHYAERDDEDEATNP